MRTAETGAAIATDRVDLVDKDDARAVALGLFKEVAHPARADADEHLHKLRPGDGEEGDARFAGDGFCHERFAGTRRADQQDALGDACAQCGELLRLLEELDDLLQLLLGFIRPRNVAKGDGRLVAGEQARLALAKRKGLVVAALGLAKEDEEQTADEDQRKQVDQQRQPITAVAGGFILNLDRGQLFRLHAQTDQRLRERDIRLASGDERGLILVDDHPHFRPVNGDALHRAAADRSRQLTQADLLGRFVGFINVEKERRACHQDEQVDKRVSTPIGIHSDLLYAL